MDAHTSARAILGMALTARGATYRGTPGLREWKLGPRVVLSCAVYEDTPPVWTVMIWPDAYNHSTLYMEQEVDVERAGELMRCAGLSTDWWRARR